MKALIKRYAERIDAATLRERAMIFAACTLVLAFVANAAFLEPLRAQQRRALAETTQIQQELDAIRTKTVTMVQTAERDPDAANRARLATLREQLAQMSARVAQEQRRFTPPEQMRSVLEGMLRGHRGLALVDLRTLQAMPVGVARGAVAQGAAPASGVFRHGIEFTVSGDYEQIYEYLRQLERMPTQLYWGRAELKVVEHPVLTLKLTAYTVSFDPAWLIV